MKKSILGLFAVLSLSFSFALAESTSVGSASTLEGVALQVVDRLAFRLRQIEKGIADGSASQLDIMKAEFRLAAYLRNAYGFGATADQVRSRVAAQLPVELVVGGGGIDKVETVPALDEAQQKVVMDHLERIIVSVGQEK